MGPKINDLNPILSKNTRPVAAIKSLRFVLYFNENFQILNMCYSGSNWQYAIIGSDKGDKPLSEPVMV